MIEHPHFESGEKLGVLEAREAIAEAHHARVPEPTAQSVLEGLGAGHPAVVGADATVLDALRIMSEKDKDAVAVTSPAGLVGIFTERDHARLDPRATAQETPVADVMTRNVASVAPADGLRHCLALSDERRGGHVAIVDQGRLLGLLSRTDLLAARVVYLEYVYHEIEMDQKLMFLQGTYSC
jgi:signal-transduction protein with cAMP-binding, CBS, and nucleotidyltransferase domain